MKDRSLVGDNSKCSGWGPVILPKRALKLVGLAMTGFKETIDAVADVDDVVDGAA